MKSMALLGLILLISTAIGFYYRSKNGVIRKKRRLHISEVELQAVMAAV